jgi:hypothetical protein
VTGEDQWLKQLKVTFDDLIAAFLGSLLLIVETALDCLLQPWGSSQLGYRLARLYAERYSSSTPDGLIPKSAPLVEDIAGFWGRRFLGRGWKKRVAAG